MFSWPYHARLLATRAPDTGLNVAHAQVETGQWVMGQMGHQIWMGHMGRVSPIDPLRSSLQFKYTLRNCSLIQ